MANAGRPNLLYILSDQHSPEVAGCYGDPLARTPNLDGLAANGVLFENVYCPSPLCVPSRMAMLTGLHPHQNEVWTNDHILNSAVPTFAHALGAGGYRPVLIGRMHSVGPDQLRGYAERLVGDHGPNYVGGREVPRGVLAGTAGPERVSLVRSGPGQSGYQVHDEYVAAATVDELNRLGVAKRAGQPAEPFCLSVGFMLPHQPFVARREDYDLYRGRMTPPSYPAAFADALHPYLRWWRQQCGIERVSEEETLRARAAYWALVTRLDHMIGQILRALRENDLAGNTLIVYTSDHGEQAGEHGLWWKQTFYEQSIKVPAILSWPGVLPAGARCGRVVSSLDVMATMLDALGAPPLPRSNGRSMLGLLTSAGQASWDDEAFSEYCTDDGWYCRMVRRGDWKLCHYHGHEPQLFNVRDDPGEQVDRARDPSCRPIRDELTARVLDGWDPERIAAAMAKKREDNRILHAWARRTQPVDQYRWAMTPEMNYLDDPAGSKQGDAEG